MDTFFLILAVSLLFSISECVVRFGNIPPPLEHRLLNSLTEDVIRYKTFLLPTLRPKSSVGELIEFALFDDEIYVGQVRNIYDRGSDGVTWTGELLNPEGELDGTFGLNCILMSCSAELNVDSSGDNYRLCPFGSALTADGIGTYMLKQMHPIDRKKSGLMMMKPTEKAKYVINERVENKGNSLRGNGISLAAVDTDLILDLLVMYSPEALAKIGGRYVFLRLSSMRL
jgi:hypothetical protein